MELKQFGNAQYIALETFKKNGDGVVTPVWVVQDDEKLFVWTVANSWKVKRIRNNRQVRLAESDARGVPKSDWITANAQVLKTATELKNVQRLFKKKYGFTFSVFGLMGKLRGNHHPRIVVEITVG